MAQIGGSWTEEAGPKQKESWVPHLLHGALIKITGQADKAHAE